MKGFSAAYMTTNEFIKEICKETGFSQKKVRKGVQAGINIIKNECLNGGKVKLPGFGVFETRFRKPRIGVNPKDTTKKIPIDGHDTPYFKVSKSFKKLFKKRGH